MISILFIYLFIYIFKAYDIYIFLARELVFYAARRVERNKNAIKRETLIFIGNQK